MSNTSIFLFDTLICISFCQKYSFCVNVHVWETFTSVHKPRRPSAPSFRQSLPVFFVRIALKADRFLCSPLRSAPSVPGFHQFLCSRTKSQSTLCGDWLATCPSIENQYVGLAVRQGYPSHSSTRVTSENTTTTPGCVVGGGFTLSTASFQVLHAKASICVVQHFWRILPLVGWQCREQGVLTNLKNLRFLLLEKVTCWYNQLKRSTRWWFSELTTLKNKKR